MERNTRITWPPIKIKWVHLFFIFSSLTFCTLSCNPDTTIEEENPTTEEFSAKFKLSGDGYNEMVDYNSNDNLIMAKLTNNELWIRLAASKTANGENSPHIDIDICNYAGTGTYLPMDPRIRPCKEGLLWDVYWHDSDKIYLNEETSSPCELKLTLDGDVLKGTFSCGQLVRFEGTGNMEILEGSFSCKVE